MPNNVSENCLLGMETLSETTFGCTRSLTTHPCFGDRRCWRPAIQDLTRLGHEKSHSMLRLSERDMLGLSFSVPVEPHLYKQG